MVDFNVPLDAGKGVTPVNMAADLRAAQQLRAGQTANDTNAQLDPLKVQAQTIANSTNSQLGPARVQGQTIANDINAGKAADANQQRAALAAAGNPNITAAISDWKAKASAADQKIVSDIGKSLQIVLPGVAAAPIGSPERTTAWNAILDKMAADNHLPQGQVDAFKKMGPTPDAVQEAQHIADAMVGTTPSKLQPSPQQQAFNNNVKIEDIAAKEMKADAGTTTRADGKPLTMDDWVATVTKRMAPDSVTPAMQKRLDAIGAVPAAPAQKPSLMQRVEGLFGFNKPAAQPTASTAPAGTPPPADVGFNGGVAPAAADVNASMAPSAVPFSSGPTAEGIAATGAMSKADAIKQGAMSVAPPSPARSSAPKAPSAPRAPASGGKDALPPGFPQNAPTPKSQAEFDALPPGSPFFNPKDGKPMWKKAQ